MSRTGPLGEEAALAVYVQQALLHLEVFRRVEYVEQREEAAERIPEARPRIVVTLLDGALLGTVMENLSRVAYLVELVREECRTVEARVEGACLVEVAAADLYASQHLVPRLAAFLGYLL